MCSVCRTVRFDGYPYLFIRREQKKKKEIQSVRISVCSYTGTCPGLRETNEFFLNAQRNTQYSSRRRSRKQHSRQLLFVRRLPRRGFTRFY